MPRASKSGNPLSPMLRKKPTRNNSLKLKRALAISEALEWLATSIPKIKAPRSGLRPTISKPFAPATSARSRPKRMISSPWPQRSIILSNNGRIAKRITGTNNAQGEGSLPAEAVKKITAITSCIIRIPMATRPCSEDISPFSSRILTAKTVLEKLNANAISRESLKSRAANLDKPAAASKKIPVPKTTTIMSM